MEKKIVSDDKDEKIEQLSNAVMKLENKIKEIETQTINSNNVTNINNVSNVTNNNNNNNVTINNITVDFRTFMNEKNIQQIFNEKYTTLSIPDSGKLFAIFTIDNFLSGENRPIYLCSDKNRHTFTFFDKDGKKIKDPNADTLIKLLSIHGMSDTKYMSIDKMDNLNEVLKSIHDDNTDYVNHLSLNLPQTIENRQIHDDFKKKTKYVTEKMIDISEEEHKKIQSLLDDLVDLGYSRYMMTNLKTEYNKTNKLYAPSELQQEHKQLYLKYLKS